MDRKFNKTAILTGVLLALSAPTLSWAATATSGSGTHKQVSKTVKHTVHTTHHSAPAAHKSSTKHHASVKQTAHHTRHKHSVHHASAKSNSTSAAPTHAVAMNAAAPIAEPVNPQKTDTSSHGFGFGNLFHVSGHDIVNFAAKTVRDLRYTHYKLGGNDFDPSRGVYRLDCSAYVDNLLQHTNPQAYSTLAEWSKTYKPTTADYYAFFDRLPSANWGYWHKIAHVEQLEPGDIMVFRYNQRRRVGGHVMLVMGKPVSDPASPNVFWVNVADSAASGHSDDTRPAHTSGVGIGKLLVKVDPNTKKINSYAWKAGAGWRSNISFVMASPQKQDIS